MVVQWHTVSDAPDLSSFYNQHVAIAPTCYQVTPKAFYQSLHNRKDSDTPDTRLQNHRLLVGEQEGQIVGFADVAIEEEHSKRPEGLIRFLAYAPGYRSVGQTLLDEAEKHLWECGVPCINAFLKRYSYRFYHLGFGMLTAQLGHVLALMSQNGYAISPGVFFLKRSLEKVTEPVAPADEIDISIDKPRREVFPHTGMGVLPDVIVRASCEGQHLGDCLSSSVGSYVQNEAAQESCFTVWMEVAKERQGEGLGRYLLHRALWEMRQTGYKHALLSTQYDNGRALLLYTNHGYQILDTTYEFSKARN